MTRVLVGGLTGAVVFASLTGPGVARSGRHQHKQLRSHQQEAHGGRDRRPARRHARHAARPNRRGTRYEPPVRASMLIDADTGEILEESNADASVYPASLAKMMTLYLTFAALEAGRLRPDRRLAVSAHAAGQEPTKLWLKSGDRVLVKNLILALVTRSANDAAVVLAEGLAGSEPAFAREMTAEARRLGMAHTVYCNASGLPDRGQHTTARDTVRLALALTRDFPREYPLFSTRQFVFRGKTIAGHDRLLDWYPGADGLKTGFIDASGFNLASSAVRNGHRLIGVIFGGSTAHGRDRRMAAMLDRGFAEIVSGAAAVAMTDDPDTRLPAHATVPKAAAKFAAYMSPVATAVAAERAGAAPAEAAAQHDRCVERAACSRRERKKIPCPAARRTRRR